MDGLATRVVSLPGGRVALRVAARGDRRLRLAQGARHRGARRGRRGAGRQAAAVRAGTLRPGPPARPRSWSPGWTGSRPAATASGWWSATAASCGWCPSAAQGRPGRGGQRAGRPVPGPVHGRPGRPLGARVHRGRPVHAARLLGPRHGRGGLARRPGVLPAGAGPDRHRVGVRRPAVGGRRRAGHLPRLHPAPGHPGQRRQGPGGPARRGPVPGAGRPLADRPGAARRVLRPAGAGPAGRAGRDGPARRRAGGRGRPAGGPGRRPRAAAGRHRGPAGGAHGGRATASRPGGSR